MKTKTRILLLGIIFNSLILACFAQAQIVTNWFENFDDGNGNNRWYADAGVWQIGSPTYGPPTNSMGSRAYSYPDCATTGLTGNYPAGLNSRLVRIQTFTVPPANEFPCLRFWHWYNFAWFYENGANFSYDYGVVEIRVGTTGAWQAVSPHYTTFSGDWTYALVDLSAYAGQSVQVAFHAVGSVGGTSGWYIDNIALVSGIPALNDPETFGEGIGNWYAEQGFWQAGSPTKSGGAPTNSLGAQAYLGTNCAVTLLSSNYGSTMNSRLISPYFVLPPASLSPFLRFWHWYNFAWFYENGANYSYDYGVVEIQVGTNAWQAISPEYTETAGAYWTEPFIDLSSYGGQTVRLAFHAVGTVGNDPGWYINDVQVYPYAHSPAAPYLNINLDTTGTNAIVNWTSLPEYTGFTLQSTTNLLIPQTNWNTISPVVVNGQNMVTNSVSRQKFFQLVQ